MRVFSTLIPLSNESKSCMRVDKGEARVCVNGFLNSHATIKREQELHVS